MLKSGRKRSLREMNNKKKRKERLLRLTKKFIPGTLVKLKTSKYTVLDNKKYEEENEHQYQLIESNSWAMMGRDDDIVDREKLFIVTDMQSSHDYLLFLSLKGFDENDRISANDVIAVPKQPKRKAPWE